MDCLRLSCDGATVGPLWLPPFRLSTGDLICLHPPCLPGSGEEQRLLRALTGEESVPGLRLFGQAIYARPAVCRAGFFGLFRSRRAVDWLRRTAGVTAGEAAAIVARLDLRAERIPSLSFTERARLGLEAAWARGADLIVFSRVGLDPFGSRALFEAVAARLGRCPAIHLSYEYETQGRKERDCPPGATCIELNRSRVEAVL